MYGRTLIAATLLGAASPALPGDLPMQTFSHLAEGPWQEVFHDPGSGDWTQHWFLDGEKASVRTTPEGMELKAGPTAGDDACHAVLWTRATYAGDLKIEYDFTRLDTASEFVTILYVQATGSGSEPYLADISAWRELRQVPAMRIYFDHLNTYHISYAAFDHGNTDPGNDYIRARRYVPESGKGLEGTELPPSYDRTGLFTTGVPHRMTVIKSGQDLYLHIQGPGDPMLCHWHNTNLPPIQAGRIGLRHMYTRHARYHDLRISVRPVAAP